jgi:DNA polymerase-3 subunit beta
MEIRLNRAEFLTELTPMQGIVERRTTIPVLSHILLRADGDRLALAATDLDVSLTSWCDAEVATPGAIAVQAKKFIEIIRAVVDDEVHLKLEDERRLTISAGRSRFKINGLSPEDFPTLPTVSVDGAQSVPFATVRGMISKVLFAVSTEESRFQLNGALFKVKEDAGLPAQLRRPGAAHATEGPPEPGALPGEARDDASGVGFGHAAFPPLFPRSHPLCRPRLWWQPRR